MKSLPKYLQMWKGTLRVRVRVPDECRPIIGKNFLVRGLGTSNVGHAEKAKYPIVAEFMATIAAAKKPAADQERNWQQFLLELRLANEMFLTKPDPVQAFMTGEARGRLGVRMRSPTPRGGTDDGRCDARAAPLLADD
jgi:hypothetical protein